MFVWRLKVVYMKSLLTLMLIIFFLPYFKTSAAGLSLSKATAPSSTPIPIPLWSYYDFLPFMNNADNQGLVYELAALLTKHSQGRFVFKPQYYPRRRIDRLLANGEVGLVALVNPQWFPGKNLASSALLTGYDTILSPCDAKINALSKESIEGKRFIGVAGHRYPAISSLLSPKALKRLNSSSMHNLFKLIAYKRGDYALVPTIVALNYRSQQVISDDLINYSPQPHRAYTRHLVYSDQQRKLYQEIEKIIVTSAWRQQWQATLSSHNVHSLAVNRL